MYVTANDVYQYFPTFSSVTGYVGTELHMRSRFVNPTSGKIKISELLLNHFSYKRFYLLEYNTLLSINCYDIGVSQKQKSFTVPSFAIIINLTLPLNHKSNTL